MKRPYFPLSSNSIIKKNHTSASTALLRFGCFVLSAALLSYSYSPSIWAQTSTATISPDASSKQADENVTVHGQKNALPRGYSYAPSMEIQSGPDPDHANKVHRDPVTGANISRFGSAFQNSNPTQQGQLGDATGNGWLAPHGNR